MKKNIVNKIMVMLAASAMAISIVACGTQGSPLGSQNGENVSGSGENGGTSEEGNTIEASSAEEVFNNIWNLYSEDDMFPAMGGDMENAQDGKPGVFDLAKIEDLTAMYYVPITQMSAVSDVATLMHMMNANTFTGAVLKVDKVKAFADELKSSIEGVQWICGFPDKLIIAEIGSGYVAYAFGEGEIMQTFLNKVMEAYPNASVIYNIDLAPEF
ncbi:MAG: hypothetical protein KBS85_01420 [Lachnospiraceae bacterium]|nr:hypothetical protein [Candidatus Merdinaster equi]